SAFMVVFMRISLHVSRPSTWRGVPARSNASSGATQSDVEEVEANFLAPIRILGDTAKLDLFSKARFTKHGKWGCGEFFGNAVFARRCTVHPLNSEGLALDNLAAIRIAKWVWETPIGVIGQRC